MAKEVLAELGLFLDPEGIFPGERDLWNEVLSLGREIKSVKPTRRGLLRGQQEALRGKAGSMYKGVEKIARNFSSRLGLSCIDGAIFEEYFGEAFAAHWNNEKQARTVAVDWATTEETITRICQEFNLNSHDRAVSQWLHTLWRSAESLFFLLTAEMVDELRERKLTRAVEFFKVDIADHRPQALTALEQDVENGVY